MTDKQRAEFLQMRSQKLLASFTECAPNHMVMFWLHGTDDEDKYKAEVLLDPVMLAELHEIIGAEETSEWCDAVTDICHETLEKIMIMYSAAVGGQLEFEHEEEEECEL